MKTDKFSINKFMPFNNLLNCIESCVKMQILQNVKTLISSVVVFNVQSLDFNTTFNIL